MAHAIDLMHPIEAIRRRLGLTQQQLAERLSVSRQHIVLIEGGKRQPSMTLRYAIAAIAAGLEPVE